MKTKSLFEIDDRTTGDRFTVEYDQKGNRLLVTSEIDKAGARCMIVIDGRDAGLRLAAALVDTLGDAPAPKARASKLPKRVRL
jgi:hypothetical protein